MDASPDDSAWSDAAIIPKLTLAVGADARIKAPRTRVLLLWSKSYLFVRFVCADAEVFTPHRSRDKPHHEGDVAEIFLDPEGRAKRWLEIQVTPRNDVFDKVSSLSIRPRSQRDGVLDPESMRALRENERFEVAGLRTAARRIPGGWIADIAIPAAAITGSFAEPLKPRKIRANFVRYDWPKSSAGRRFVPLNWSPVRLGCPHISPARMGVLKLARRTP